MPHGSPGQAPFRFVVGCQRSGTNLLASLIDRGSDCAVATEDRFVLLFARWLWLAGDLRHPSARRCLVDSVFAYLYLWEARDHRGVGLPESARYGLVAAASSRAALAADASSFDALVRDLFAAYARQRSRGMAAGKIAMRDGGSLAHLTSLAADVRLVHIVRDGRDVVLSWQATYFGPRTVAGAARRWVAAVTACRAWGHRHPDRYVEVRYEDLVRDPDRVVAQAGALWGAAVRASAPLDDRAQSLAENPWLAALAQPPQRDKAGQWVDGLSLRQQAEVLAVAGPLLAELGYWNGASPDASPWRRLAARGKAVAADLLASVTYRRAAADLLPMGLLLAARLRLPVNAVLLRRLDRALASLGIP